jgi:hypothetical protein
MLHTRESKAVGIAVSSGACLSLIWGEFVAGRNGSSEVVKVVSDDTKETAKLDTQNKSALFPRHQPRRQQCNSNVYINIYANAGEVEPGKFLGPYRCSCSKMWAGSYKKKTSLPVETTKPCSRDDQLASRISNKSHWTCAGLGGGCLVVVCRLQDES